MLGCYVRTICEEHPNCEKKYIYKIQELKSCKMDVACYIRRVRTNVVLKQELESLDPTFIKKSLATKLVVQGRKFRVAESPGGRKGCLFRLDDKRWGGAFLFLSFFFLFLLSTRQMKATDSAPRERLENISRGWVRSRRALWSTGRVRLGVCIKYCSTRLGCYQS